MNVLSLFNGMSFCSMALESLGVNVNKMYSSEIDKYANQATQAMFPDTIQLGDVTQWREWNIDWASIDLVTGGFPCQAWSMAGKQLGDKDERGMLFWTMLDIMKHVRYHNPKADFLIENVKMKKEFEQYITTHTETALGKVHKILINSALVSAQNRNRYYWTSFDVEQPEETLINLGEIIEHKVDDKYLLSEKLMAGFARKAERLKGTGSTGFGTFNVRSLHEKCSTLTARYYKCGITDPYIHVASPCKFVGMKRVDYDVYRKLTPRECFRLQTVPEHHIDTLLSAGISDTQLYKMCGNGWTMEVIKHIFKALAIN